jgi:hypothetical protein
MKMMLLQAMALIHAGAAVSAVHWVYGNAAHACSSVLVANMILLVCWFVKSHMLACKSLGFAVAHAAYCSCTVIQVFGRFQTVVSCCAVLCYCHHTVL